MSGSSATCLGGRRVRLGRSSSAAKMRRLAVVLFVCLVHELAVGEDVHRHDGSKWPTVVVALIARNKAHTLPHFLSLFQQLDYPKERIALWWVYTPTWARCDDRCRRHNHLCRPTKAYYTFGFRRQFRNPTLTTADQIRSSPRLKCDYFHS